MPGGDQTLWPFLWRAMRLYPDREVVARTPEGVVRHTYAECASRIGRLVNALDAAGIEDGDTVGTVCWNHGRHFEAYFGVPLAGARLHTVNPLLPPDDLRHAIESGGARVLVVDPSLVEALAAADGPDDLGSVERVVVVGDPPDVDLSVPTTDYASFVAGHDDALERPDLDPDQPAGLCHTSGTTGRPKGVAYTHRHLWSHAMAVMTPMGLDVDHADVVMPVVPMFHVNAWGLPHAATAAGAKQVYPGPSPDPADIVELVEREGVTLTAGVPTVWLGVLEYLETHDADLSSLERVVVGGAAPPERLIRGFDDLGVRVVHGWGMTETSPVGAVSHLKPHLADADYGARLEKRTKQGLTLPGLEFDVVDDDGESVPWDGETFGELLIRGPWVVEGYVDGADATEDGWLRTGDVVTVDDDGYLEVVDRAADVIKSGGEWISSQRLGNAIMDHPDVSAAAVVGVPHERWGERPVAFVVADVDDREALRAEVETRLRESVPEWWLPDRYEFVESLPKTATGKFDKRDLRSGYGEELDGPVAADPPD